MSAPPPWLAVLDAQPTAIVLLDAQGQVVRQNPAADALQGQLAEAGAAWPWGAQLPSEEPVVRGWVAGLRLEGHQQAEGAYRWLTISVMSGESLPCSAPTLVLAPDGQILAANAAALRLGIRVGRERLQAWLEADDQEELSDALVAPHDRSVAFLIRDRHGGGRYLTGRLWDRTRDPRIGGILLVCQEESRLHEVEQRLRELERRFLRLLEGIPEAVVLASVHTEVHYVNHRARDLLGGLGVPDGETLRWLQDGTGLQLLGTPQPYPRSRLPVSRALKGESCTVDDIEVQIGGQKVVLELSAAPIRDRSGSVLYVVVTIRTITERRRLEQRLQQVGRMDAVGQLSGELAHDFSNFLTAIVSCGQLALESLSQTHPARGELEEILNIAHRAGALTRQLLTLGRQQPMALQRLHLGQLLQRSESLLARMLGPENTLLLELDPELWWVDADAGMMDRVFINLTLNARDAMPGGGTLVISSENTFLDEESVAGLGPPGAYVVISVSDTGEGMTPEVAARVFEPFFTTKPQGKGTGLGLSMVYGVLRQQGGFVQVSATPGAGACFRVTLPRSRTDAEDTTTEAVLPRPRSLSPADEEPQAPPGEGTILLVDDEEAIRDVGSRILRRLGYTVDTFSDAESAWQSFRGAPGHYDLLIMDVDLPGMSGLVLASRVLEADPSARILLISGREPVVLPAPTQFLAKPFTPQALGETVWRMLRTRP